MNVAPICPSCDKTWNNMYEIVESLRVGELEIKNWHATKLGINGKLTHKPCNGVFMIPLVTDVFNDSYRWVYLEIKGEPNVYKPLSEL